MPETTNETFFAPRELSVKDFAAHWHGTQQRKLTGEPYVNHLTRVAKIVKTYTGNSLLVAAAFCHDLYEDTRCTEEELMLALSEAGYSSKEGLKINKMVWELTDEFVNEKYPALNRHTRKTAEAKRLWYISPEAQTVKYADLIDNVVDLASNDPGFARTYLMEMNQILEKMNKGLPKLYKKTLKIAKEVGEELKGG
ncbi:MAG: (p)ppGpp synthase/HD superfamily hydrolase [Saprospiraceae bacterium]|jgi:(p)ppGpp synthase/HD superfamily hydrolase